MFGKRLLISKLSKSIQTCIRNYQVTVLGATTEIGQTISMLLRSEPSITKLILHDVHVQTPGVALDLSHIPTSASVKGFVGEDTLVPAVADSDIVIGAGGVIRKPGISCNLWLSNNTQFIQSLARAVSRLQPSPFVGIVTDPINSLIPMAAEVMRNHGHFDPKKLFGITNVDTMRAQCLFAAQYNLDPRTVYIPVIGGHSDKTCLPLLSQAQPALDYNDNTVHEFTSNLQKVDETLTAAMRGFSPVLSIAYSALMFTRSVLSVLDGEESATNAYIYNNDFGTEYFSGLVNINENGVKNMEIYNNISSFECQLLEDCIKHIRKDVLQGKKILQYS